MYKLKSEVAKNEFFEKLKREHEGNEILEFIAYIIVERRLRLFLK